MRGRRHADVAGRTDVEIEPVVGSDGEKFPAVRLVARQVVVDDRRFGRVVELVLDIVDLRDLVQFGNIERVVVVGDAVRTI